MSLDRTLLRQTVQWIVDREEETFSTGEADLTPSSLNLRLHHPAPAVVSLTHHIISILSLFICLVSPVLVLVDFELKLLPKSVTMSRSSSLLVHG